MEGYCFIDLGRLKGVGVSDWGARPGGGEGGMGARFGGEGLAFQGGGRAFHREQAVADAPSMERVGAGFRDDTSIADWGLAEIAAKEREALAVVGEGACRGGRGEAVWTPTLHTYRVVEI